MRAFRTVLEQKIWERRQTFEEFVEFAELFAREHKEPGTLGLRHLQRLVAGQRSDGQPLGPLRPATARLLERIFGVSVDVLLSPPAQPAADQDCGPRMTVRTERGVVGLPAGRPTHDRPGAGASTVQLDRPRGDLAPAFDWLDERAGWLADTSKRKVTSRLAKLDAGELLDRQTRRAKIGRSQIARTLANYYRDQVPDHGAYRARFGERTVMTSVVTRVDWLDLACPLFPGTDRMTLVQAGPADDVLRDGTGAKHAVHRLAEAAVLGVRVANLPLYRLVSFDARPGAITGAVGLMPFVEYAVTMDLLESELADALGGGDATRPGALPLRDRYLPDLASVIDFSGRTCAGGVLALCAVARPSDPYRGAPDFALLVQERSGHVLNAPHRLAVIPKGFHQPLADVRADAAIGATLRRKIEQELFGRDDVDVTSADRRVAAPMHPGRLSEPMRWLTADAGRLQTECTAFGLNLVSGNYEFAGLVVIEDDEFWSRFGGQIEANWEAAGLRVYSSLDDELIGDLISDETWSNEGLFALLQGLRRLRQIGGERVRLPDIEWELSGS